jgi:hypothetical protein
MQFDQKRSERWNQKIAQWDEARFKYADIIVSSGIIRREFFERCKELRIDPIKLAVKHGISINAFNTNYVKTEFPQCTKSFDQEKFLKMIESIGINIRVSVILKPLSEVSVELKKKGIIKDE